MTSLFDDKGAAKLLAFSGDKPTEWRSWKSKFKAMLESKDLLEVLLSNDARPAQQGEDQTKYDASNRKLFALVTLGTTSTALLLVSEFEDPREGTNLTRDGKAAWRALERKYEHTGGVRKQDLLDEMKGTSLSATEDPDKCFGRLQEIQSDLRTLGVMVPDDVLLGLLMHKMPAVYRPLRTIMDYDGDLTFGLFKTHVRTFYDRNIARGGKKTDESAFTAFNGTCNQCGEHGHKKFQCPKKTDASVGGAGDAGADRDGRAKLKCSYCKKKGHAKKDCYSYARKKQQQDGTANEVEEYVSSFVVTAGAPFDAEGKDTFWLDSRSSSHFTPYEEDLFNIRRISSKVTVANKQVLEVTAIGNMSVSAVTSKGQWIPLLLKNVMLVPGIVHRLMSVRKLEDHGGKLVINGENSYIETRGYRFPIFRTGMLYGVSLRIKQREESAIVAVSAETWHQRLGHRNMDDMRKLGKLDIGVPSSLTLRGKCDVCETGKHKHASFSLPAQNRSTEVLALVHSDLTTVEQLSMGGAKYAVLFTEDLVASGLCTS